MFLVIKGQIKMSLDEIENEIRKLDRPLQQRLLKDIVHMLGLDEESFALLKVSEQSFEFWNNPEDSIYDNL